MNKWKYMKRQNYEKILLKIGETTNDKKMKNRHLR